MFKNFHNIFKSNWVIALLCLIIFLLNNGYIFGWDDQHLEIPLLKKLIDPSLYQGDYYVESLTQNFTSLLYPVLAHIIKIEHIPATYFLLYLISRFFLFFWAYKLWLVISQDRFKAFLCIAGFLLMGRVEEFLYRTFSHQEFALAIIFAGFYFFYKNRFFLAAFLFGIAANVNAIYSLFPILYLLVFLILEHKKKSLKLIFFSGLTFLLSSLPVVIWLTKKILSQHNFPQPPLNSWITLYKIACPQNFLFLNISLEQLTSNLSFFIKGAGHLVFLFVFYGINFFHNPSFKKDLKTQSMALVTVVLLAISFIFTYVWPNRFILDLNLVRTSQYLLFMTMGYTMLLMLHICETKKPFIIFLSILAFALIKFGHSIGILSGLSILALLFLDNTQENNFKKYKPFLQVLLFVILITSFLIIVKTIADTKYSTHTQITLYSIVFLLSFNYSLLRLIKNSAFKKIFIIIPLVITFLNFSFFHYRYLKIANHGEGFWQLQRNWIDMQKYVQAHTPKKALFLVPHDMEMGGFRIWSERTIICCYRDCGIVGFDYSALLEWQNRLNDIEPFKVYISDSIQPAIYNALLKYKVNYIVFMRYAAPKNNDILEEIYANDAFVLYKVLNNAIE